MCDQLVVTLKVDELKAIISESISTALSKAPPAPEEEIILKRVDVARLFKISYVTLNQWMRDGRIIYHRINSRIFFKKSEVMQALNHSVKKYGRK